MTPNFLFCSLNHLWSDLQKPRFVRLGRLGFHSLMYFTSRSLLPAARYVFNTFPRFADGDVRSSSQEDAACLGRTVVSSWWQ